LGGEPDGLPVVRGSGVVRRVRIVVREGRGQRPQQIHPVRPRQRSEQSHDALGQRAGDGELGLQFSQLRTRGEPAMPQQVADLLEARMGRQVVDVVPAIREHAAVAIDETDRRGRRHDIFEAGLGNLGIRRGVHDAAIISDGRRLDSGGSGGTGRTAVPRVTGRFPRN
jgi:hypothetical protein